MLHRKRSRCWNAWYRPVQPARVRVVKAMAVVEVVVGSRLAVVDARLISAGGELAHAEIRFRECTEQALISGPLPDCGS